MKSSIEINSKITRDQRGDEESDVVIVGAKRTAQGRLLGQLSSLSAVELGANAAKAALSEAEIIPSGVQAVVVGQVVQAGQGQNPARQTANAAGIPKNVPAVTLNSVCLSGLHAVIEGARRIILGEVETVLAVGQESMSNGPHLLRRFRQGKPFGQTALEDSVESDALTDADSHLSMGFETDQKNSELGIDRRTQDQVAVASHLRAAAAQESGVFESEIVPVPVRDRKGNEFLVDSDEGVRPDSTPERLAKLRTAFWDEGTITAGNASPISDGAAAVVMTTRGYARENNLEVLATVVGWSHVAGPDSSLHFQPSNAISKALKVAEWKVEDLDFLEINEAFASVSIASVRQLGVDPEKVNIHGGAIALGHPVGCTGARLVVTAAQELARRTPGAKSAVSLCGGGGQGDALLLRS